MPPTHSFQAVKLAAHSTHPNSNGPRATEDLYLANVSTRDAQDWCHLKSEGAKSFLDRFMGLWIGFVIGFWIVLLVFIGLWIGFLIAVWWFFGGF